MVRGAYAVREFLSSAYLRVNRRGAEGVGVGGGGGGGEVGINPKYIVIVLLYLAVSRTVDVIVVGGEGS